MQFGYFDSKNREYVITDPRTPEPWVNYLGSPEYGALISGNAEGYSFVKSGANGRLTRFRFNSKIGLPGRFIYLNDGTDFWSASWRPVGKDLEGFKTKTRHGTAYTVIETEYNDILTETLYYVPIDKTYEIWAVDVTNKSNVPKTLEVTGFTEFTNHPNYEQDNVNLQYSGFITYTEYADNIVTQHLEPNMDEHIQRSFGLTGAGAADAWGSLDEFIGGYNTYANPVGVTKTLDRGKLETENAYTNTSRHAYTGNCCGAIKSQITLGAGECKTLIYVLGAYSKAELETIVKSYDKAKVLNDLTDLKKFWYSKIENLQVKTPSHEFNEMLNTWNAYNCFITFIWSRAASFIYCGLRNGYGYRDTVQDIQGIIHLDPQMAKEKIRFMLSAQVSNGAGLPLVKFNHNAGHEDYPGVDSYDKETGHPSYRADDALWLFPTIFKYIAETGDTAFLDEVVVYADGGKALKDTAANAKSGISNSDNLTEAADDTVYDHLKRALTFTHNNLGPDELPAGLHADWNDCLRLGKKGESTFVAFQLYYAYELMSKFAAAKDDVKYAEELAAHTLKLSQVLSGCWDGDRFIRGIREDGVKVGARADKEANMWLNPQSWSVISGFSHHGGADTKIAMDTVYEKLNTPYGAELLAPYYHEHYFDGCLMKCYNGGCKENGGIFSQPQGWLILAEALLNHGDRAFEYFMETSPAAMNGKAEIRGIEPYAHGQFTEGHDSPFAGRSHVHWLTGTASTVMVGCVEGILGLRPTLDGLIINPAIPSEWKEIAINKNFRGKKLNITVKNRGAKSVTLNGEKLERNLIKADALKDVNEIIVEI